MKYLFLDIDGVLNHESWYEEHHQNPLPFPLSCFDPECVKRVNEILEKTGAQLVISSSWRTDRFLSDTFVKVGLPGDFLVTPSWKNKDYEEYDCRGEEIQAFLDKHKCENYVIIDDDNDMLDSQKEHFVRTCAGFERYGDIERLKENGGSGLTDKLKDKVIEILNKKGDD